MLRIHFMQRWFGLSDPAMEASLYDIQSMRQFAGLYLAAGSLPDGTTILSFRPLLEWQYKRPGTGSADMITLAKYPGTADLKEARKFAAEVRGLEASGPIIRGEPVG